jgi:hypothetical protein
MSRERMIWAVALVLVGGAAFFGGQQLGVEQGIQRRGQAAQEFFAQRGGQGGAPGGAPGQGGNRNLARVSGVVEQNNGASMIVSLSDGTKVTVALAADGVVRRQVDGQLSDLRVGETVLALGARTGDSMQASMIQIGGPLGAPGQAAPPGQP